MRETEEKRQDETHYYLIASTMATHAVSALGKPLSKAPQAFIYGKKKVEVRSVSGVNMHLKFSTKKLFDFLLLLLTRFNDNKGDWSRDTVYFQLQEFMEVMGYDDTRQMHDKCFKQIVEDLDNLRNVNIREDDSTWFVLVDRYRFVDKGNTERTKKNIIAGKAWFEVAFPPGLMDHLRRDKFIAPFLIDLFRRVGKNETAYSLAKRMILHYGTSNKRNSRNRQKLKVKTLLGCCPIDTDQSAGNVRRSFEKAMDCLQSPPDGGDGMIHWKYLKDGKVCASDEVSKMQLSHKTWLELVVEFCPVDLFSRIHYSRCPALVASFKFLPADDDEQEKVS